MPREITDPESRITWTCVQAFAGLDGEAGAGDPARRDAARVKGAADRFHVVCTPSGGARSVRIELPGAWETLPDQDLAAAIQDELATQG